MGCVCESDTTNWSPPSILAAPLASRASMRNVASWPATAPLCALVTIVMAAEDVGVGALVGAVGLDVGAVVGARLGAHVCPDVVGLRVGT